MKNEKRDALIEELLATVPQPIPYGILKWAQEIAEKAYDAGESEGDERTKRVESAAWDADRHWN